MLLWLLSACAPCMGFWTYLGQDQDPSNETIADAVAGCFLAAGNNHLCGCCSRVEMLALPSCRHWWGSVRIKPHSARCCPFKEPTTTNLNNEPEAERVKRRRKLMVLGSLDNRRTIILNELSRVETYCIAIFVYDTYVVWQFYTSTGEKSRVRLGWKGSKQEQRMANLRNKYLQYRYKLFYRRMTENNHPQGRAAKR